MLVPLFHFQDATDRNTRPLNVGELYPDKNGNKFVCNDDTRLPQYKVSLAED